MSPAEKTAVHEVQIKQEWCKGCGICAAFCPKEALVPDQLGKVELAAGKCNGCGVCVAFCPDFALALPGKEEGVRVCRK